MENYRKKTERDIKEIREYAFEDMLKEFLGILDNLERARQYIPEEGTDSFQKSIAEGLDIVIKDYRGRLEKLGVREIDALDRPFDPSLHHAQSVRKTDDREEGMVLDVIQKGYMLNSRVLRPAMVVVSGKEDLTEKDENL